MDNHNSNNDNDTIIIISSSRLCCATRPPPPPPPPLRALELIADGPNQADWAAGRPAGACLSAAPKCRPQPSPLIRTVQSSGRESKIIPPARHPLDHLAAAAAKSIWASRPSVANSDARCQPEVGRPRAHPAAAAAAAAAVRAAPTSAADKRRAAE